MQLLHLRQGARLVRVREGRSPSPRRGRRRTLGAAFYAIAVASLDDADPDELAGKIKYVDGRHDRYDQRPGAIDLLKSMFETAVTDPEQRTIIRTMEVATRQTGAAGRTDGLTRLVLRDTLAIIHFWTEKVSALSYELLEDLEHDLLWLYRHNAPASDADFDSDISAARNAVRDAILSFRDRVNSDAGFVTYKTLVGFNSVFPPAWEDPEFDDDPYREQRIDEMVAQVTEDNADSWLDTLRRCAATESDDLATFPSFAKFLSRLAAAKPTIMLDYLDRVDGRLADFLHPMLAGLEEAGRHEAVTARLRRWLEEGRYLRMVAHHLQFAQVLDGAIIDKALQVAIGTDDSAAILRLVALATARHADIQGGLIDRLLMPAIAYLAARDDSRWVNAIWPRPKKSTLFGDLSAEQAKIALDSLVRRDINYRTDEVLAAIGTRWPMLVIEFFGDRMRLTGADRPADYSPVPFGLHDLQKPLSKIPRELVSSARAWFDEDDGLFAFRGGQLLKDVFPHLSPEFEEVLLERVVGGDPVNLRFVTRILRAYEGQTFLHSLCKEIVAALRSDDPLLDEIEAVLDATGVVSGQYGLVTAYQKKRSEIEPWRDDPREEVRCFADRYILSLNRMIAAAQRRGEESLELRRREFADNGGD